MHALTSFGQISLLSSLALGVLGVAVPAPIVSNFADSNPAGKTVHIGHLVISRASDLVPVSNLGLGQQFLERGDGHPHGEYILMLPNGGGDLVISNQNGFPCFLDSSNNFVCRKDKVPETSGITYEILQGSDDYWPLGLLGRLYASKPGQNDQEPNRNARFTVDPQEDRKIMKLDPLAGQFSITFPLKSLEKNSKPLKTT